MLEVVGALIQEGTRVLIAQRLPGKREALCWEFPGGKVEAGETPEAALVRELQEELGITVAVDACCEVVEHGAGERRLRLSIYRARIMAGTPTPLECHAVAWQAISDLDPAVFAPADRPLVSRLRAATGD